MPKVTLNALRTFEAVASRLSFSEGAEALNVSPAAVSSQIRTMEEQLGQPLFLRQGRRVELTKAGEMLLPGVQRGMAELRKAVQLIEQDRNTGVLNISMVPIFLQKWMLPRLTGFYRLEPEIDLRVSADRDLVNFDDSDVHAAIRYGPGGWPGVQSLKLMDDWILPVCSPAYLAKAGPINSSEDLEAHPLLYAQSGLRAVWLRGLRSNKDIESDIGQEGQGLPRLNDALSTLLAAEQGEGIALSRWSLVARDIDHGRLVAPLDRQVKADWSYYFVAPEHYLDMPKVAAFRDWMVELCAEFPPPAQALS